MAVKTRWPCPPPSSTLVTPMNPRTTAVLALLLIALPAQAMTMQRSTLTWNASGTGAGASLSIPDYGVDATMGYDRTRTYWQQDLVAGANPTSDQVLAAQHLSSAQVGRIDATGLAATRTGTGSGEAIEVARLQLTPGRGWFFALDRNDLGSTVAAQTVPSQWLLDATEHVKVRFTPSSISTALGAAPCAAPARTWDNALKAEDIVANPRVQVSYIPQAGERADATDKYRTEALQVSVVAADLPNCRYSVTFDLSLRFVFEANFHTPNAGVHPGDISDYNLGAQNFAVCVTSDSVCSASTQLVHPMTVLYAPVLPTHWLCSLQVAGRSVDDTACKQLGLDQAPATGMASGVFRNDADTGYYVVLAQEVAGVDTAASHFIPDAGTLGKSQSRLLSRDASGAMVSQAWPY